MSTMPRKYRSVGPDGSRGSSRCARRDDVACFDRKPRESGCGQKGRGRTKILATTATADRDALEACIAAGMDAWLSKPFDLTDSGGALQSLTRARVQVAGPTSEDA
jgi:CheY-like chemotaxis protein